MEIRQLFGDRYVAGGHRVAETAVGMECTCGFGGVCVHVRATQKALMTRKVGLDFRMRGWPGGLCRFCRSADLVKAGLRKNMKGDKQLFKCRSCGRRSGMDPGFARMRHQDEVITTALGMYCGGMSVRAVSNCLAQRGIRVSYRAVYGWICRFAGMMAPYLDGIIPHVGRKFRADEVWIRAKGEVAYLFACIDDKTRFWLAHEMARTKQQHEVDGLLRAARRQAGGAPEVFITDGLHAYKKGSRRVFGRGTVHRGRAGIRSRRPGRNGSITTAICHPDNNRMERFNGLIRDRERPFRGLKREDSAVLECLRIFYNFVRPHGALGGRTPAEAAGITVDGPDRWRTIIQNAALDAATV